MGAAAGHINHLYDDQNFTKEEIVEIFNKITSGRIPVFEKIDGQNLMISVKDSKLVAARNKGQLKNPVDINIISELQFHKYPHVREVFDLAIARIVNSFEKIPIEYLNSVFENGVNFLNLEIVDRKSKNVIDYGDPKVVFNSIDLVENGNIISHDVFKAIGLYCDHQENFNSNGILSPILIAPILIKFDGTLIDQLGMENGITAMGSILLQSFNSISDKKTTISCIKSELSKIIRLSKTDIDLKKKISIHLNKLIKHDGLNNLPHMEGIVFKYANTTYKITGSFAPINQILGILKYSR